MYERLPAFVLGFHGCTSEQAEKLLSNELPMRESKKEHDWLGQGMYFWENDPVRADEWARTSPKSNFDPCVVGAVIDLGHCLNLMNYEMLAELKIANSFLERSLGAEKYAELRNVGGTDLLKRHRDCAVMRTLHQLRKDADVPAYDTVRAVFWEGEELYDNAGFKEKNHIQICVRDPKMIKGFFRPRS